MNKNNPTIDLLRFLFAMMIMLFHGCKNLPGQGNYFINGRIGVEFFFIVSGYLMVSSASRYAGGGWRSTVSFIGNKIRRLSPDVFIAWFVAFAVVQTAAGVRAPGMLVKKMFSGFFEMFFIRTAGFTGQVSPNRATWYLSAMLLGMAILFPLLLKKREMFTLWFAPLAAIFLYAYINITWDNGLAGTTGWSGIATKGMLRALAGLCLGASCYTVADKLGRLQLKWPGKLLASLAGTACFLFVGVYAYQYKNSAYDFVLVMLLGIGVTIAFSGVGWVFELLSRSFCLSKICTVLSKFSVALFLSHGYWSNTLEVFFPTLSGTRMLLVYIAISFGNALLLMLVSKLIRNLWPKLKGWMKRGLVKDA